MAALLAQQINATTNADLLPYVAYLDKDQGGKPRDWFYDSYQGLRCAGNALGGCSCSYTVEYAGKFKGHWESHGSTVTHFDAASLLPTQVDYCAADSGNHLTLSGHDGTSILGEPGVMSLSLEKAP